MKPTHFVFIVTGALMLAACSRPEPAPEPVRAVKLLTVGAQSLVAQAEYAGEVRARTESRLGFRVGGKLVERPAEVGQRVVAGQLLARLDAQDLALAGQAAQAGVAAAQTQRDLAAADLKRFQTLLAQGFVSSAEIERRQATLDAAAQTFAQTTDNADRLADRSAFAWNVLALDGAFGLSDTGQSTFHQHLHQTVRARFGRLCMRADFLVLPKG